MVMSISQAIDWLEMAVLDFLIFANYCIYKNSSLYDIEKNRNVKRVRLGTIDLRIGKVRI
jgi:hypothetical protein